MIPPGGRARTSHDSKVVFRALLPTLFLYGLLPLTFLCPLLDSRREPFVELTGLFAELALNMSLSGGMPGAPVIGLFLVLALVTRPRITWRCRRREFIVLGGVLVAFAGGGSWLNENKLKPAIGIARPNIVWLAGKDGGGPLRMTPKSFYELGPKPDRREPLRSALDQTPAPLAMSPAIRAHWIHEVGFSFPSGHAFASMFFATFFPPLAAVYLPWRRRWVFLILPVWAVTVCWSRLVLRVHTPLDITAGGMEGISFGLLALLTAQALLPNSTSDTRVAGIQ